MEILITTAAGIGSLTGLYFITKSNWIASSISWNITAALLWLNVIIY